MLDIHESIEQERDWLVQWCTYLTGMPDEANDLAHDTMLEALRHAHKLTDPAGRRAWLAVIARYVYWRWRRQHWREARRSTDHPPDEEIADGFVVTEGLEQRELQETLHRALGRIPAATRQMLVAHYFQHASYRTIAEMNGVSEEAVSMRLSRGRRQLRHLLTTEFAGELRAYRSDKPGATAWSTTALWCSVCGQHRLLAQLPPHTATVAFRCPGCHPDRNAVGSAYPLSNRHFARLLGAVRRPSVLLHRATTWAQDYFHEAIRTGRGVCTHCGRDVTLRIPCEHTHTLQDYPHFLYLPCDACGTTVSSSLQGYLLTLPDVQRFKARHERIHLVSGARIEAEGVEAQVTTFKSVTSAEVLEVIAPLRAQDLHYPIIVVAGTGGVQC